MLPSIKLTLYSPNIMQEYTTTANHHCIWHEHHTYGMSTYYSSSFTTALQLPSEARRGRGQVSKLGQCLFTPVCTQLTHTHKATSDG